jgi:hypothetical protein
MLARNLINRECVQGFCISFEVATDFDEVPVTDLIAPFGDIFAYLITPTSPPTQAKALPYMEKRA